MLTLTSPHRIWAHRLPAGAKLAALAATTMVLFSLTSPLTLTLALAAILALTATGGKDFAVVALKSLRPLWPFILIVGLWHLWTDDPTGGAVVMQRLLAAVLAANFVTMTTRLTDLLRVVEWLCRPLAALGLSPKLLALAVALTVRFLPVLMLRAGQIGDSWRARSPRRPGWRLAVPLTLAALDDAEQVAEALRARGGAG